MTKTQFQILGEYYGYPKCCIDAFSPEGRIIWWFERSRTVINAAETIVGCGFIPCQACAAKVVRGELTLSDLIKDRKCPKPFPFDDMNDDDKLSKYIESQQA